MRSSRRLASVRGTVLAGIVGAFVAVPLTAVAVSVTKSLRADETPPTSAVN